MDEIAQAPTAAGLGAPARAVYVAGLILNTISFPPLLLMGIAAANADTSPREQREGAIIIAVLALVPAINLWLLLQRFRSGHRAMVVVAAVLNGVVLLWVAVGFLQSFAQYGQSPFDGLFGLWDALCSLAWLAVPGVSIGAVVVRSRELAQRPFGAGEPPPAPR